MILFVFPKAWEFYKFFAYLTYVLEPNASMEEKKKRCRLYSCRLTRPCVYEMVVYYNSMFLSFEALFLEESDVGFGKKLRSLGKNFADVEVCLVGSCGSACAADLGAFIFVTEAVKGDRGRIDQNSRYYLSKKDLEKIEALKLHAKFDKLTIRGQTSPASRRIVSLNFLSESILDLAFSKDLFDMETFDFFSVCADLNADWYYCYRFVTDLIESKATEDQGLPNKSVTSFYGFSCDGKENKPSTASVSEAVCILYLQH